MNRRPRTRVRRRPQGAPEENVAKKIVIISDGTGKTARRLLDAVLAQYSLDSLDYKSYAICKVRFEGTQMFLKEKAVSSGIPSCGDTPGIYEVRLFPDGKIKIVKIKEECSPRAGDTALQYDPVR